MEFEDHVTTASCLCYFILFYYVCFTVYGLVETWSSQTSEEWVVRCFPYLACFRLTFLSLHGDESIMSMLSAPDMIWPLQTACGTYTWPSTQHSINSMLFSVRVPVLSVKTYSTWGEQVQPSRETELEFVKIMKWNLQWIFKLIKKSVKYIFLNIIFLYIYKNNGTVN